MWFGAADRDKTMRLFFLTILMAAVFAVANPQSSLAQTQPQLPVPAQGQRVIIPEEEALALENPPSAAATFGRKVLFAGIAVILLAAAGFAGFQLMAKPKSNQRTKDDHQKL